MRTIAILAAAFVVFVPVIAGACEGCGCRGGPGYRGPNGKCVGWAQLGKICGSPPTQKCTAEMVAPEADKAAQDGQSIEEMKDARKGNGGSPK